MKIALLGFGRMGRMIEALAQQDQSTSIVLRIDSHNVDMRTIDNLQKADVAIDFSIPESAVENIMLAVEAGVPIVSGTTGWLDQWDRVTDYVQTHRGAFLYASNFSVGVNLFFALNQKLAQLMQQRPYAVRVEETHHIHKKDAPSGTAITLAEQIIKILNNKTEWVHNSEATDKELLILSHRENEVPGTHIVRYDSAVDSLEIKHEAHSREGFARGALMAAKWLPGREGVFSMQDVLGL